MRTTSSCALESLRPLKNVLPSNFQNPHPCANHIYLATRRGRKVLSLIIRPLCTVQTLEAFFRLARVVSLKRPSQYRNMQKLFNITRRKRKRTRNTICRKTCASKSSSQMMHSRFCMRGQARFWCGLSCTFGGHCVVCLATIIARRASTSGWRWIFVI